MNASAVIRCFAQADTDAVLALWRHAFPEYDDASAPHRNPRLSIARKLATQPELFFVATRGATLVGTIMAGYDGHRGWLYSLAVAPDAQRQGVGTRLVTHAQAALVARGCPKIGLQILEDKPHLLKFYRSLRYQVEKVVSLGKRMV